MPCTNFQVALFTVPYPIWPFLYSRSLVAILDAYKEPKNSLSRKHGISRKYKSKLTVSIWRGNHKELQRESWKCLAVTAESRSQIYPTLDGPLN